MGNASSSSVDEVEEVLDPKEAFIRELMTRLWVSDVLPQGEQPKLPRFPTDRQDKLLLPLVLDPVLVENRMLPLDLWHHIFDSISCPRVLGRLCCVSKTHRRLVLSHASWWRRHCRALHPALYANEQDPPSLEVERQLLAWNSRVFVGDVLLPSDLDSWLLAPPRTQVSVLVASLDEPGCGKSNLIARFVRNRFVGDRNRMSLALEQQRSSKRIKLGDGSGGEREIEVEIEECSTGLVDLYAQHSSCDCVVLVSSVVGPEFRRRVAAVRDRLLELRGCAPLVVARTKSDLGAPQEDAARTRLFLRKSKIPFFSTSAKRDDGAATCAAVFEAAVKLATCMNVIRRPNRVLSTASLTAPPPPSREEIEEILKAEQAQYEKISYL